ncbi:tRNA (N(6)-L-threonylcarbamoyladenosine(37)-C(2))-methylthiotransferase MtaB, partial [bacterium]|nr:tRNA (N(6)-L-threonylcarbamoyladenosine(37)-C(2))-methylthiotransferase MtaB [bacterium]
MEDGRAKRRKTFSIKTLGCKLNQYESECLRYNLEKMGFEFREFSETADFYIINTCTVTAKT